ncbi:MAG TPA: branched-chain amino acid ABC transporter permease [Acidimicrobiales bacterium]|nr:branched-chain amino acid ABC transporter permease [Acidimicrobiales bacterium]
MHAFVNYTLDGLSVGMVYAAVALSLVLIWRSTRILNFAGGAMAMLTTYIGLSLIDRGANYWVAFFGALIAGLVLGAVVERVFVRPVENKPPINAVIVTLGLFTLIEALAGMIWGNSKSRSFPAHFSGNGYRVGTTRVAFAPFDTFIVVAVALTMVALLGLFQYTSLGLKMRAAAFEPVVARLQGIRVSRMLTLGWALAAAAGSLAGVLVAPRILPLSPNYMDDVLVYGFSAAVLGGLDSPVGALIGGLVLGLTREYVGGYVSSTYEIEGALVLLIAVLMVRPQGLFNRIAPRRV